MSSTEAKQRSAAAKAQALSYFKKRFPHAQMSRFQVQVEFDANRKALGRVLFPDGDGSWENPLIEDQKYWSPALKAALGAQQDGGFPAQLSPNPPNKPLSVPTIDFSATTGQSVADLFNKELKIYVSPTDYFTTKFRKIFKAPKIKVTTSVYARPWIKGPQHGLLAAAAELCCLVRDNRLWRFPGNVVRWQRHPATPRAAAYLLPVSRILHDTQDPV